MPAEVLSVILEGRPIGEVERRANGSLQLRFDRDYTREADATPLSVSMPPTEETHGDARITSWLWNLLPDNSDVLNRWGRAFGVSVASPFPLLGAGPGHDCAGAVQFCHPSVVDDLLARPGDITWLAEAEVATRLRALRRDSTSWLGPGFTGQFSLGGAQAKTALHHAGGRWGVPSGSTPTTHILKPPVARFDAQDLNEHLCMAAARTLGMRVAETTFQQFEDETAIVVARYDRTTLDGSIVRIHQEDFCQALSVPPARKYQADGGPTPRQIVELLRAAVPGPDADDDVWRFADGLAFNWLIAGTDAHAKNYGLLLLGAQVRLAPFYDIASYLPYDDSDGHRITMAMKIGDDYRLRSTDRRSAWERTADELRLDRRRLLERVLDLTTRAPDAFAQAATAVEADGVGEDLPARLVELVTQRSQRCAAVLDESSD